MDLTQTQYASALEWLKSLELLIENRLARLEISAVAKSMPTEQLHQLLFERFLLSDVPLWLPDADSLLRKTDEIPEDAAHFAHSLGLNDELTLGSIRNVHGRIDLSERTRVGAAGEQALVQLLERHWPQSTYHVAEFHDGFGYDLVFQQDGLEWHIEVKATTRRGRLVIHLSRHEYDVSLLDRQWRLVVVGLDDQLRLKSIATVQHSEVLRRSPRDTSGSARWEAAAHEITSNDVKAGLSFISEVCNSALTADLCSSHRRYWFTWLPDKQEQDF